MRKWLVIVAAGGIVLSVVLANLGASLALADIGARPVLALTRDGGALRIPVGTPGQPAAPGAARALGGQGILFGYRFAFALPAGEEVACTIRFRAMRCGGGWMAERPDPAPAP